MAGLVSKETVRIELIEGQWVEVRRFLTYGDRKAIRACFNNPNRIQAAEEANTILMLQAIVDWNVDGKKLPITRETIDGLDDEKFITPLLLKMNPIYQPVDESQKKD
jgi:hypothetical protein